MGISPSTIPVPAPRTVKVVPTLSRPKRDAVGHSKATQQADPPAGMCEDEATGESAIATPQPNVHEHDNDSEDAASQEDASLQARDLTTVSLPSIAIWQGLGQEIGL